jgi:hypothetical protein
VATPGLSSMVERFRTPRQCRAWSHRRGLQRVVRAAVHDQRYPRRHDAPLKQRHRVDNVFQARPDKYRRRPTVYAVFFNHPPVTPHVHSLVVVHPSLADRFLEIVDELEATWRRIPVRTSAFDAPTYANRTLRADVPRALEIRELIRADHLGNGPIVRGRIRRVVDYSAKLGRRRDVIDEDDLFIVLPPSGRSRGSAMSALDRFADSSRTS